MPQRSTNISATAVAFILAVVLVSLPNFASSATFELGGEQELNCVITLRGPIEPGDTKRLKELVRSNWTEISKGNEYIEADQNRLCLDSIGGSISEALNIVDTMLYGVDIFDEGGNYDEFLFFRGLGTAIPQGARCESACALVFMAGGWFEYHGAKQGLRRPDRTLHVDGKLGFHAPKLQISGNNYDRNSVEDAFDAAIHVTEMISQRSRVMYLSPGLLFAMISTPPSEMFTITTVAQAAGWGIQIQGAPAIEGATEANVRNVCRNLLTISQVGIRSYEAYYNTFLPRNVRGRGTGFFVGGNHNTNYSHRHSFSMPDYPWSLSGLDSWRDSAQLPAIAIGLDSQDSCGVKYTRSNNAVVFETLPRLDSGFDEVLLGLSPEDGRDYSWLLYSPHTKLSDLARLFNEHGIQVPGYIVATPVVQTGRTRCAEFRGGEFMRKAECPFQIDVEFSASNLLLSQRVAFRNPVGELFSYGIDIISKQSPMNPSYFGLEEKIVPNDGVLYAGTLLHSYNQTPSPEVQWYTPRKMKEESDELAGAECFNSTMSDSTWCFEDEDRYEPEFDSSNEMFPEY